MMLTALPTQHDMPPLWDHLAVLWEPWQTQLPTTLEFHLSLGEQACQKCGSLERPLRAVGQLAVLPEVTHEQMRGANARGIGGKYGLRRLFASRCSCGHDQVYDIETDELFDLEPQDYGDDGAYDPEPEPDPGPPQGVLF